ncbi:MAG: PadR family transcriptional regulator [Patescibacteria group bacterium]
MEQTDKLQQLRKGLLEVVLLKIINKEKVYVADMLAKLAETEFQTQEGTLYPLLSRLRRESLLDYEWIESESGPPRKYYSLTDKGRKEMQRLEHYLKHIITSINSL